MRQWWVSGTVRADVHAYGVEAIGGRLVGFRQGHRETGEPIRSVQHR
jgi:hypothetical protein